MRRKWQDPDYRAKQQVHFDKRRADPTKSWSRLGIGDGFTRASAAEAWQKAEKKAKATMEALRRANLL